MRGPAAILASCPRQEREIAPALRAAAAGGMTGGWRWRQTSTARTAPSARRPPSERVPGEVNIPPSCLESGVHHAPPSCPASAQLDGNLSLDTPSVASWWAGRVWRGQEATAWHPLLFGCSASRVPCTPASPSVIQLYANAGVTRPQLQRWLCWCACHMLERSTHLYPGRVSLIAGLIV